MATWIGRLDRCSKERFSSLQQQRTGRREAGRDIWGAPFTPHCCHLNSVNNIKEANVRWSNVVELRDNFISAFHRRSCPVVSLRVFFLSLSNTVFASWFVLLWFDVELKYILTVLLCSKFPETGIELLGQIWPASISLMESESSFQIGFSN